jgi:hypothetical protein
MKDYNLFLDDKRNPSDAYLDSADIANLTPISSLISLCQYTAIPESQWVIVRDFEDFALMLRHCGIPKVVSFDHDLHMEHMRHYFETTRKTGEIKYVTFEHKTGLQCAELLAERCEALGAKPDACYIHSANEYGKINIKKIIDKIYE